MSSLAHAGPDGGCGFHTFHLFDSVVPVRAYKCSEGHKLHDEEGRMRAIWRYPVCHPNLVIFTFYVQIF